MDLLQPQPVEVLPYQAYDILLRLRQPLLLLQRRDLRARGRRRGPRTGTGGRPVTCADTSPVVRAGEETVGVGSVGRRRLPVLGVIEKGEPGGGFRSLSCPVRLHAAAQTAARASAEVDCGCGLRVCSKSQDSSWRAC